MDENTQAEPILLAVPLSIILDIGCSWDGKMVVDYESPKWKSFVDQIIKVDETRTSLASGKQEGKMTHVSILEKNSERPRTLAVIWRITEWRTEYDRELALKKEQERRYRENLKLAEKLSVLVAKFVEHGYDSEVAALLSAKLLREEAWEQIEAMLGESAGYGKLFEWKVSDEELKQIEEEIKSK